MCKKIIFILLMVSGFSPLIYAASFDCSKAGTDVEHLICDNEMLSQLDEQLSDLYKQALKDESSKAELKKNQIAWLKNRNKCKDKLCLSGAYRRKIGSLSEVFRYGHLSNPNLPLCEEFKAYLERNANEPLYCDLIPDEAFSDFRLPKWEPAPEGLPLRIEIQSRTVPRKGYENYSFEDYQKLIKEAHEYVESGSRYRVSKMDLNHDGERERILYRDNPSLCSTNKIGYHESKVYGDHLNIDSTFITPIRGYSDVIGQIFFYKNKAYQVTTSYSSFQIYEPTRGYKSKFIVTQPICTYSRRKVD